MGTTGKVSVSTFFCKNCLSDSFRAITSDTQNLAIRSHDNIVKLNRFTVAEAEATKNQTNPDQKYNLGYEVGIGEIAPGVPARVALRQGQVVGGDCLPVLLVVLLLPPAPLLFTHQGQPLLLHSHSLSQTPSDVANQMYLTDYKDDISDGYKIASAVLEPLETLLTFTNAAPHTTTDQNITICSGLWWYDTLRVYSLLPSI